MDEHKPDGRANNGGARTGSGRKSAEYEAEVVKKLRPLDEIAFQKITELVNKGDRMMLKLFMEYRFGKARQVIEMDGQVALGTIPIDKWLDDNTSKEPIP